MPATILSIPVSRIKTGAKLFVAFSLIAFFVLFQRSSISDSLHHLREFDIRYFFLALALVVVDWGIAGTRILLFARKIYPDLTFGAAWRGCVVHIFLAGVTPSQTGGAAAQVYVMYLEGMSVLGATVACFVGGFITTVLVLMMGASLLLVRPGVLSPDMRTLATISFAVYVVILIGVLLTLTHPGPFKRATRWLVTHVPRIRGVLERHHVVERIFKAVDTYHDLMTGFFVRGKRVFTIGLLLTVLIYLNKFFIGWVVLRGLGIEADLGQVLLLQVIPLLVFYFSPTPGAAGLAEVSTMAVMGPIIPQSYQAIYVILWRFFTLIINMMVGVGVVMGYLSGRYGKRRASEAAPTP